MEPETRIAVAGGHVVAELLDGEAIIINLENGRYYSLQGSGAFVWSLLAGQPSLAEIASALESAFECAGGPDVAAEVRRLAAELESEGLVARVEDARPEAPPPLSLKARPVFVPPQLEVHTDMQDFLLVDPIHEVDERGWPQRREDS